jgi:hypothetical protein
VAGTNGVVVKCVDIVGNTESEGRPLGTHLTLLGRKRGERMGLDTPVVHAVNDEC